MPRCNYIRRTGAKCKKNCISNSDFCNIHTTVEDQEIDVEMVVHVDNDYENENDVINDDDGDGDKVDEVSALMFQLSAMNISMATMLNENAALKDKNKTLSQAVDILLEEKKNMQPTKTRAYTVKGLYQRAQLEHYYHRRSDPDILAQVDQFYKNGGMPNYNKHGIKICIDGIFDKYSDEDKQYWLNVSQKYFADRNVAPK
jgi:hypothetical protein